MLLNYLHGYSAFPTKYLIDTNVSVTHIESEFTKMHFKNDYLIAGIDVYTFTYQHRIARG